MADPVPGVNRHPLRRHALRIATAIIALVIVVAVGWTFAGLLKSPALQARENSVRYEYLLPAGLLYLVCHTLWGTFWVQLLWGQGVAISWFAGVRIYFVSQFGKYVPGKAWVILLRVALLRGQGISPAVIAVTGTYETLTNMAAGAVVGVCFLPWAGLGIEFDSTKGFALFGLCSIPLVLVVVNRLGRRVIRKYRGPNARPLPAPTVGLLIQGFAQALVGWTLLALSLWLTVCGIATEPTPLGVDHELRRIPAGRDEPLEADRLGGPVPAIERERVVAAEPDHELMVVDHRGARRRASERRSRERLDRDGLDDIQRRGVDHGDGVAVRVRDK